MIATALYILLAIVIFASVIWAVRMLPDPPFTPKTKQLMVGVLSIVAVILIILWLLRMFGGGPVPWSRHW